MKNRLSSLIAGMAVFSIAAGISCAAGENESAADHWIPAICDYMEMTPSSEYLGNSALYPAGDMGKYIYRVIVDDLDLDGYEEVLLKGAGAGANNEAAILDYDEEEEEVRCVLSEWAHILGRITDEENESRLAVLEGNGNDVSFHFELALYGGDWERTVLGSSVRENGMAECTGANGEPVTQDEFMDLRFSMEDEAEQIDYSFEGEMHEYTIKEAVQVLRDYCEAAPRNGDSP